VAAFPYAREVTIELLLASPLHRYQGRPSEGPLDATGPELRDHVDIRAHLGIPGDRYFGQRAHVTASVTVFAAESLDHVALTLGTGPLDAADTRRNIVVRGLPIDEMRGQEFSLDTGSGPVVFRAHRPANPCAWMDVTLAPGAHRALRGRGGMRCEPLTDGTLRLGPAIAGVAHDPGIPPLF
jgi:MOSC domain-containing protein YiiM